MNNNFKYNKNRNQYPLKIITQIDAIEIDEVSELETLLLIDDGDIDISDVPKHIIEKHGLKVLVAYEDVPAQNANE